MSMEINPGTFNIVSPNAPYGMHKNIAAVEGFHVTDIDPSLPDIIVHQDITTLAATNWMAAEYMTGANIFIGYHAETKEDAIELAIAKLKAPTERCHFTPEIVEDLVSIREHGLESNEKGYAIRNYPQEV